MPGALELPVGFQRLHPQAPKGKKANLLVTLTSVTAPTAETFGSNLYISISSPDYTNGGKRSPIHFFLAPEGQVVENLPVTQGGCLLAGMTLGHGDKRSRASRER